MKVLFTIVFWCLASVTLLGSACNSASVSTISDKVLKPEEGTRAFVTTEFQNEGCSVLLEIAEGGEKVMLMPIELEDQYKIHGLEVLITYSSSRIMQSRCQIGRPIVISGINLVE